jgi:hypothetical protein
MEVEGAAGGTEGGYRLWPVMAVRPAAADKWCMGPLQREMTRQDCDVPGAAFF